MTGKLGRAWHRCMVDALVVHGMVVVFGVSINDVFFQFFSTKNVENDYFDQHLGCAVPKWWSKYSTIISKSSDTKLFFYILETTFTLPPPSICSIFLETVENLSCYYLFYFQFCSIKEQKKLMPVLCLKHFRIVHDTGLKTFLSIFQLTVSVY